MHPAFFVFRDAGDFMAKTLYRRGDPVVLHSGILTKSRPSSAGEVMAVLPETLGRISYRVQFENEGFQRNVGHDEIYAGASVRVKDKA